MICLQGHTTGMHISLGRAKTGEGYERDQWRIDNRDSDFCVRAVKEGFAAIALEERNFGEKGYQPAPWPECHNEALTAFLMGRTTIGRFRHCECNYVPGIANYFTMADLMAMACPRTVHWFRAMRKETADTVSMPMMRGR